jgi:PKD repeat protein
MQYEWDFDDGLYSHLPRTTHVYDAPGTYHVRLQIDAPGFEYFAGVMFSFAYIDIEVVPAGTTFTANADGGNLGTYEGIAGEPIDFVATAVGGNAPYVYRWNFGDGTPDGVSEDQYMSHQYEEAGTYTATLTVTDYAGKQATDTAEVVVNDIDELFVSVKGASEFSAGETILFTCVAAGGQSPYSFNWDFGDGITSYAMNPVHVYENAGTYTVALTVTDALGSSKTATKTVEIAPTGGITEVEITDVRGGFLLSAVINSNEAVDWSIDVDGLVFIGGHAEGTAIGETDIHLPFSLGFGNVEIIISAGGQQETYTGFMVGPFLFLH